jgi:hypothetical protein
LVTQNPGKETEQKAKKSFWATMAMLNKVVREDESTVGVLTALHVFSSDIYKTLREIYGEDYVAALLDAVMKKGEQYTNASKKRQIKFVNIGPNYREQTARKMKRYDPGLLRRFR